MSKALSITAIILSLLFFIPLVPFIGLILGIVAFRKSKDDDLAKGLAIGAIALGIIVGMINILFFLGLGLGLARSKMSNMLEDIEEKDRMVKQEIIQLMGEITDPLILYSDYIELNKSQDEFTSFIVKNLREEPINFRIRLLKMDSTGNYLDLAPSRFEPGSLYWDSELQTLNASAADIYSLRIIADSTPNVSDYKLIIQLTQENEEYASSTFKIGVI